MIFFFFELPLAALFLGILMLDTQFPRPPGDIGNADTWAQLGIPVRMLKVQGASPAKIVQEADPRFVQPFVDAARALEAEGAALNNLTLKQVIGVPNTQLQREAGYTDDEIEEFKAEAGVDGLGNALLDNFESGQGGQDQFVDDQGNPVDENGDPIQQG